VNVLVDTSVWIDFFNGHPSPEAETLVGAIDREEDIYTCGVVMAEFLQGISAPRTMKRLERYFLDMSYVAPREPETYLDSADLFRALRRRGKTIRSTVDCLIACLAAEHGLLVLAKDRDMKTILESGLSPALPYPIAS